MTIESERIGLSTYMKKQDELRLKLDNKEITHAEYKKAWNENYRRFFNKI